jgi:BMFP domain-containing protein YqiC
MFASIPLDELAKKLYHALPISLQQCDEEIQQQFKAILQSTLTHLDLVTRDEFDVQVKVLARTREKVETLQRQVDQLLQD